MSELLKYAAEKNAPNIFLQILEHVKNLELTSEEAYPNVARQVHACLREQHSNHEAVLRNMMRQASMLTVEVGCSNKHQHLLR